MRQRSLILAPCLLFLVPVAAWAAWLGWDQHRDVHPDGSVSGPYEAWQVIGLVLTLLAPVYWAASRHHVAGAVLGTTAGLTVAAYFDWSDDASGLFMIGVGMVMMGSLVATFTLSMLISSVAQAGRRGDPGLTGA
ncbi:hypothetical protein DEJ50_32595 [Streptomyces venezuelae]|uniref:Integral membrane protein n=1 Tax=Streptomyces venezuelae TaxID=54571 RepID=A0A5P2D9P9_STRVZ|nr:hypothetical protein [Streptomyces venezuelae]QES51884.1 hypothetical protein DEJ50_32595 [Streptomyces venezuelae]